MKYYINLTNGIEFLKPEWKCKNYNYIRIRSTLCERKDFNAILDNLDYNFLLDIATGGG